VPAYEAAQLGQLRFPHSVAPVARGRAAADAAAAAAGESMHLRVALGA
jgi:hypothetical protein